MSTKSLIKSTLVILLALCVFITYLPMFAFAAENDGNDTTTQATEADTSSTDESQDTTDNQENQTDAEITDSKNHDGFYNNVEDDDNSNYEDKESNITFVVSGADSISVTNDMTGEKFDVSTDTTKVLPKSASITVDGTEGKYTTVIYGETLEETQNSNLGSTSTLGGTASVGIEDDGYVLITIGDSSTISVGTEDEDGNVTWSELDANDTDWVESNRTNTLPYKVGEIYQGTAVVVKNHLKVGSSTATFKHTTGFMVQFKKNITANCASGHNSGLGAVGSSFTYKAKIVTVDNENNRVKVSITYYPKSNRNHIWTDGSKIIHGGLSSTQKMYRGNIWLQLQPRTGFLKLTKSEPAQHYSHPENYSLIGAVYNVYEDANCTVLAKDASGNNAVLTTKDESGNTNILELYADDYYIKEVTASAGHKLDTNVIPANVTVDHAQDIPFGATSVDESYKPRLQVVKKAADTDVNFLEFSNNYTLKGAEYRVFTDAGLSVVAKDTDGNDVVFVTNNEGKTNPVSLDLGHYWVQEKKASKGFLLDEKVYDFELTAENENTTYVVTSVEEPTYDTVKFHLQKDNEHAAWSELKGATYALKYYDVDASTSVNSLPSKATRTWLLKTTVKGETREERYAGIWFDTDELLSGSDDALVEKGKRIIPCGVFTIEEVEAPKSLARDTAVYSGNIAQPTNGVAAERTFESSENLNVHYNDLYHYEIEQHIEISIQKVDAETKKPEARGHATLEGGKFEVYKYPYAQSTGNMVKVGEITLDKNGKGKLTNDSTKADDEDSRLIPGYYVIKETDAPKGFLVNKGYTTVEAIGEELNTQLFTYSREIPDIITHTVIHKTDITSGVKELPGATLQIFEGKNPAEDAKPIEEWISTDKPHEILGLEGTYTLREITAPFGYECAEDVVFTVTGEEVTTEVSMDNKPIEIKTTATDAATNAHAAIPSEKTTFKDVVEYKNLLKNKTYTMTGKLMDKDTGKEVLDKDGKTITATKEFETGDKTDGTVELTFEFDSSLLEGKTIVVFEDLFREKHLATHADINDLDQSVGFPEIHTTALEKQSQTHNLMAGENQTIVDTVAYKGLSPLEKYKLTGTLFDKTTGQLTTFTATKEFTPEKEEGTVDIEFSVDSTGLENHTFVVYEMLAIGDIELVKHENPDDADQTVFVPEIGTTAAIVDKDVEDTVAYKNLIPGQKYVARGWLVDKKTGKKLKESEGETEFTAEAASGEVVVTLPIEHYSRLGGYKLVAFEELYIESEVNGQPTETLVAEHKDTDDDNQTVRIPSGPKTGDNSDIFKYALVGIGAVALLAGFLVGRRRSRNKDKKSE